MAAAAPILLITGPEELLLHREAQRILARHREQAGGELDVAEVRGPELGEQGLPDLRTASLFGGQRAVVVREAQALPAAAARALAAELDGSPPEALVLLLATSLGRIQTLAKRIKDAGGRIDVAPPREYEEGKWRRLITDELARHERRIDDQGVEALLERAGTNVSAIAEKAAQVAAGAPAGTITAEHVEQLVVGHGSRGSFAVADAMCERQPQLALTRLRGVLADGDEPVMVLGALAYRLRALLAVAARLDAKAVGLRISDGQRRRLQGLRRNFGAGELTAAVRVLADADAEMKGGELPGELILERAVVAIADRDLDVEPRRVVPSVSGAGR
jgi:DNA polymerase-3 subunit delta